MTGGVQIQRVDWNQNNVALLRRMWTDGYSASRIAAEIPGATRSAIIGKVHRIGLAGEPARSPRPAVARPPRPPRVPRKPRFIRAPDLVEIEIPDLPPDQSDCAVSFLDHQEGMCRYPLTETTPIEDFRFCGAPVCRHEGPFGEMVDEPYCARHQRITHVCGSSWRERRRRRR